MAKTSKLYKESKKVAAHLNDDIKDMKKEIKEDKNLKKQITRKKKR